MTLFATLFSYLKPNSTSDVVHRLQCYHCDDTMRASQVVEHEFAGQMRWVCCHGCASVLKAIEEASSVEAYLATKVPPQQPSEIEVKLDPHIASST